MMHKTPCGRTLGTSDLSSRTSPVHTCVVGAPFDHLPLVVDHPISRVPDAPHRHLALTVGTPEGTAPQALRIALPVGETGDDLDRSFDHALHLRQGHLNGEA